MTSLRFYIFNMCRYDWSPEPHTKTLDDVGFRSGASRSSARLVLIHPFFGGS